MQLALLILFGLAAVGYFGFFVAAKTVMAFMATPPSDLTRIRVHMEGLLGAAGPGMAVKDIVRTGGRPQARSYDAARLYQVMLGQPDGTLEKWSVAVPITYFGDGAIEATRLHWNSADVLAGRASG